MDLLGIIYLAIVALIVVFLAVELYKEEKLVNQLNAALVLVPFILRLLLIK